MKSLQVIQLVLQNDILKLQADFVHGYQVRAAIFYVSLTDEHGRKFDIIANDRAQWNQHWQQQDHEFEESLFSDPYLKALSYKFLYVWDRNHRLLAWTDHIDKMHKADLK
jgi:hypothetical protein